eukprot:1327402-Prymnesium_polylepis.1
MPQHATARRAAPGMHCAFGARALAGRLRSGRGGRRSAHLVLHVRHEVRERLQLRERRAPLLVVRRPNRRVEA